jgi:hypothetical protein
MKSIGIDKRNIIIDLTVAFLLAPPSVGTGAPSSAGTGASRQGKGSWVYFPIIRKRGENNGEN